MIPYILGIQALLQLPFLLEVKQRLRIIQMRVLIGASNISNVLRNGMGTKGVRICISKPGYMY